MCCLRNEGRQKALTINERSNKSKSGKNVLVRAKRKLNIVTSAETLQTLNTSGDVRVVDVRKPEDYKLSHIKGAVSIPLSQILDNDSPEKIISLLQNAGISNDTPVVVYDDTFGALAARVAWTFQYVGHDNTSLLEVTFTKWKEMGFEIERKTNVYKHSNHDLRIRKEILADANEVEYMKSNRDSHLVDTRERLNFLTEHIPGATNLPYTMLGTVDTIMKKPSEIRRFMANRGITPESDIITYCGSVGTLSGLAYYALKLGGAKKVKLYSKSFKDWKKLGRPVDEFKDANYWDLSAE
jgi:thiosulfate/3-mercaptopyruvate sulfurtransferase